MGTNYYLHTETCAHCGRGDEPLHIGKSSCGWCFSLHVGDGCPDSLAEWQVKWKSGIIKDEYGRIIAPDKMLDTITNRKWNHPAETDPAFYRRNSAEPGPGGLLRHSMALGHCVGHGEGTYDLVQGVFS